MCDPNNVTINKLYLLVPIFIPSAETQAIFIESIMNYYTVSFCSCYTVRKIVNDGWERHIDIGSSQNIIIPKYLLAVRQSIVWIGICKNTYRTTKQFLVMSMKENFLMR